MSTRCNRGFYCRSYCLLNMFRTPLCPSSGAQEYYTVVACLWYFVLWFSSCWSGVELKVMCPVCRMLLKTLSSTPDQQLENHSTKYHRQQPLYNTLSFTYFKSKFVALGTQHAMRMHRIVICSLPGSSIFFHIIS